MKIAIVNFSGNVGKSTIAKNLLKPRMEIHAGIIKDIMAGVVFIASCGAAILGIIIFYPYFISLFGKL